jgi:hypothetical protein
MKYKISLLESGIEKACLKLGIDFGDIFLPDIEYRDKNPYEGYLWSSIKNSKEGLKEKLVIHAAPPLSKVDTFPWEEWYVHKNNTYHAILFTNEIESSEGEVYIEANDKEHPSTVSGKKWFFSLTKV